MKTTLACAALTALLALAAVPASAGELKLTIDNGRVTLIATDVPVRQILAEWARVGKTTIVNGDKLMGPPISLRLEDAPESEVLEILLRSASGYIVAPRTALMANASRYDRVMIMPTSRAPAVNPAAMAPPAFNRPPAPQPIQPDVDDDDPQQPPPPAMPPGMAQPGQPGGAVNVPITQPTPGMPAVPTTQPRPGMPTAPPGTQPNMPPPNPYGTPPLPPGVRPPGRPGGGGA